MKKSENHGSFHDADLIDIFYSEKWDVAKCKWLFNFYLLRFHLFFSTKLGLFLKLRSLCKHIFIILYYTICQKFFKKYLTYKQCYLFSKRTYDRNDSKRPAISRPKTNILCFEYWLDSNIALFWIFFWKQIRIFLA